MDWFDPWQDTGREHVAKQHQKATKSSRRNFLESLLKQNEQANLSTSKRRDSAVDLGAGAEASKLEKQDRYDWW